MAAPRARGEFDVVIVGAGINGMTAAARLAGAGRSVCLVEGREHVGGFIASSVAETGHVHDTFSSWHSLFVGSPAYADLAADLHRHGLEYLNVDDAHAPLFASVASDGRTSLAFRGADATAAGLSRPRDRDGYLALAELSGGLEIAAGMLGSELRDPRRLRDALSLLRTAGRSGAETLARDLTMSGRARLRRDFEGPEVDHLWAPWLLHAGLSPDSAGGGLMLPLFAASIHGAGMPVVAGGSEHFLRAFEKLLADRGVTILTGSTVDRIRVEGGRARGVEVDGRRISAREAVLASVMPGHLYSELLQDVPDLGSARAEASAYRFGRAAMQVHLALSAPPAWTNEVLARTPLLHLCSGSGSVAIACAEAEAGLLPRRPTVVVGQQGVVDPSRAPAGAATLWIQLQEVPGVLNGDAAGEVDVSGGWTASVTDAYVDRVLDVVEEQAPGLRRLVLARHALNPLDLERANPNAVGGDPYGGSLELDQSLLWRPGPRTARHKTVVDGLWHIGSATHPGPGLGGGSGHLAAGAIIRQGRACNLMRRRRAEPAAARAGQDRPAS